MKRRLFGVLLLAVLVSAVLCSCRNGKTESDTADKDMMSVVATGFVQYDFARSIAGERADVKMLIHPGNEVHTYEPSPSDIMKIAACDVFVYTGGESDGWIEGISQNTGNTGMTEFKFMDYCTLYSEEHKEGMEQTEEHSEHDGAEHEHGNENTGLYEGYDEHVWTSVENAVKIADAMCKVFSEKDPDNADYYEKNLAEFKAELESLNRDFKSMVDCAARKTVVFGDRFPFLYLAKEYGLDYYAAFPGCASNTEASAATVAFLINKVKQENIPVVFSIEFSNGKIADAVAEPTGAKRLELHSCHNVTKDEFDSGETYISLMRKNLANLKEALY